MLTHAFSSRNATNPAEEEVKQETPNQPEKAEEPKTLGFGEENKGGEGKSRFRGICPVLPSLGLPCRRSETRAQFRR